MNTQNNNDINNVKVSPHGTFTQPGIRTLQELKDWVLVKLGAPLVTVELTDEQLNSCIMDAISIYSKYAYVPPKYLVVNLKNYVRGVGICLKDYHITSIDDISTKRDSIFGMQNDIFFGPYAFFGQGPGAPMFGLGNGNWVGSWVSYHAIHEFFDLTKRMMGSQPDWTYDKNTGMFQIIPEPGNLNQCILLTCHCEQSPEEYYGNEYVRRLFLSECKILLGTIRKKFSSINLVGGGQVDTSIGDEGKEEKNQIMENLIKDEAQGQCWFIS